jgi:TldD protein
MVVMYDGASGVDHCGTYLFDDEGRLATKTEVIRDGVLVSGISDLQSALAVGHPQTGNGRRESYERKTYARMTNTYFAPGTSTRDELIASVKRGWLLEKVHSGMEDPKNWGIQLVVMIGREILDGRLTGRVVTPVVCSGYVPDVLSDISMLSSDFKLSGSGYCGKGHKEFVKVSCGGPYVRTRMRLG